MVTKIDWALESLDAFTTALPAQSEVFLLTFGSTAMAAQPLTNDRATLQKAIATLRATIRNDREHPTKNIAKRVMTALVLSPAGPFANELARSLEKRNATPHFGGGTALYDGVLEGLSLIQQGTTTYKAMIIITDGMDSVSSASLTTMMRSATATQVPIHSIGIGDPHAVGIGGLTGLGGRGGIDFEVLRQLSERTQGSHFLLNTTDASGSATILNQALAHIAQQLCQSTGGFVYVYNPQLRVFEHVVSKHEQPIP
jgi:hypothetical protein